MLDFLILMVQACIVIISLGICTVGICGMISVLIEEVWR